MTIFFMIACGLLAIGGIIITRSINTLHEYVRYLDKRIKAVEYSEDFTLTCGGHKAEDTPAGG